MTPQEARPASRLATLAQAARYGAVGVLNTGIDYVLLLALVNYGHLAPWAANILSYGLAAANSFLVNRFWTFAGRRNAGPVLREAGVFAAVTAFGLGVSELTLLAAQPVLGLVLAKGVSILVVFAATFWLNKRVTFRA